MSPCVHDSNDKYGASVRDDGLEELSFVRKDVLAECHALCEQLQMYVTTKESDSVRADEVDISHLRCFESSNMVPDRLSDTGNECTTQVDCINDCTALSDLSQSDNGDCDTFPETDNSVSTYDLAQTEARFFEKYNDCRDNGYSADRRWSENSDECPSTAGEKFRRTKQCCMDPDGCMLVYILRMVYATCEC